MKDFLLKMCRAYPSLEDCPTVYGLLVQELKEAISCHFDTHANSLSPQQQEALEMICHKIARIVAGNPNFVDHWRDIAGYATLVANELEAKNGEN